MSSFGIDDLSLEELFAGESLGKAVEMLRLLAHRERLKVLCVLMHEGEKSVGELNEKVDLGQSALSQHLSQLRGAGIVGTRRAGQTIYYSIIREDVQRVIRVLRDEFCAKNVVSKGD
ncbi:MAG: ArsR/SmtB family transcription factor [Puniceicoccaceae bacterium]